MDYQRFKTIVLAMAGILIFCSTGFSQNGWIWFDSTPGKQKQQPQDQKP